MFDYDDYHYDVDDIYRKDNDDLCRDLFADYMPKKTSLKRSNSLNAKIDKFEMIFDDDLNLDLELNQNMQDQQNNMGQDDDECHLLDKEDLIS